MEHNLQIFLHHYGNFGIFIALSGGIIGLPIPDEVLLTFVGYQIFNGWMSFGSSISCAFLGACTGSTLSYFFGYKLGLPIIRRFGPKIGITEERLENGQQLLKKYGNFWITFGFFIPGIRHINGYLSGIANMGLLKFGLYAYSGALFWCLTFIGIGYKFEGKWSLIEKYLYRIGSLRLFVILIIIVLIIITYSLLKRRQNEK